MTITEIWRYPVKSMAGERLLRANSGPMGIAGDRVVHVEDASGAIIGVQDLRARCITTSFDPDTQIQDRDITHGICQRFEGKLALNCFVIAGGTIAVGVEVTLEDPR